MALQRLQGGVTGREVEDPRSGFDIIRRAWIHKYFREYSIPYNPVLAKQHLLSICEVRGITPRMVAECVVGPGALSPAVSAQEKRIAELERLVEKMAVASNVDLDTLDKEVTLQPDPVDYMDMDMASVRKLAKTLGITAERTDDKPTLIGKIESYGKDTPKLDESSVGTDEPDKDGESFKFAV
jgi:hypothetical protein